MNTFFRNRRREEGKKGRNSKKILPFFSSSLLLFLFCYGARADVLPQNRALWAFKREQIDMARKLEWSYGGVAQPALEAWIRGAGRRVKQIEDATGDASDASMSRPTAPFRLEERAYFAKNDGSAQAYWVAMPRDYSPDKKWPLVVFLHGYAPSISKLSPWILDEEILSQAAKLGLLVAMPYGRRNSDFVQWGQDDVLAVKSECERVYSIDPNRVSLTGTSMGGYGAYAVGLHTPGEWAAVAPISGRTDFDLWFKMQRSQMPAWKRVLFDADDPRTLIENARNTPFLTQHGAADKTVPVEHSRLFAQDAARLKLPFEYDETPAVGHENEFQFPALERAFEWLSRHPPRQTPRELSISSGDLREARNSWAQIEGFSDYAKIARLDAKIEGNSIQVETNNVERFALDLKGFALGSVALEVDGAKVGDFDSTQPIKWSAPNAKTGKSPTRCGPFKSLMRDSFVLVYGNDRDYRDALKFAREWSDCADGLASVRAASAVSGVDKRERNLILFGTRDSNPLLREIADQLPLELKGNGFRMGTKFSSGKNLGLRMVWRSPWSEEHLVGVCSGAWWGEGLPLNHKWDLLPDYIVYQGDKREKDDTNPAVVAGDFDGDWK